jgi:phosphate transport system substrate-binding protein
MLATNQKETGVSNGSCRCAFVAIATAAVVMVALSTPAAADHLIVQGSTTFNARLMVPYQAMIEAASKQKLTVVPNKSSLGLIALFDGRADLAMISSSLETEVASLRKTNPEFPFDSLRSFSISRTRIAFAINPANPVRTSSLETIRNILIGKIDNWHALGGPDLPLRVVVVREGGGVQFSVEAELLGGEHIAPDHPIVVQIGTQVTKVVEQEPGALGLAQLGVLRERNLPELMTERFIEQQLNLITLGEPTAARRAVIDAARRVSIAKLD